MQSNQALKLYKAKSKPEMIQVPKLKFVTIEGQGNPNDAPFLEDVKALYAITYKIKMSYKREFPPSNYEPYKIFPLEGIWDLIDYQKPATDKSNLKYKLMIQQPHFFNQLLFQKFIEEIKQKGNVNRVENLKYEEIEEGLCCQMLHLGPYETETETFSIMETYVNESGYKRLSKIHKEIYLSDPRRSKKEKLKTILRFQIDTK